MKKIISFIILFVLLVFFDSRINILNAGTNLNFLQNSSVELEGDYKIAAIPNDKYYKEQWYLEKINASKAWDKLENNNSDVVVAVLDSGVQIDHPDLKKNIWINQKEIINNNIDDDQNGYVDDIFGWDFIMNNNDPNPKIDTEDSSEVAFAHGTIVASIISAVTDNKEGISGVSMNAKILPLRVINSHGEGNTKAIINAIDYAIAQKVDIINFSFFGFGYNYLLEQAIQRAYDAGIIMVAAVGNEEKDGHGYNLDKTPVYPACHDGVNNENMVIGVGSVDVMDQKADFSSFGSHCLDIFAPGVSIFSAMPYYPKMQVEHKFLDKTYDGYWSGTSMSAPIVSGAIALMINVNLGMNRKEIMYALFNNTRNINKLNPDYLYKLGYGRIDLNKSISVVKENLENKKIYLAISDINASSSSTSTSIRISDFSDKELYSIVPFQSFDKKINFDVFDINGDNKAEIITAPQSNGGPHVKIFSDKGKLLGQFFAYDKNFRGGVNLALGNFDKGLVNLKKEIITAPQSDGGPHVKIFSDKGELLSEFFAYNNQATGGVKVDTIDFNKDGLSDIVLSTNLEKIVLIRVFQVDNNFADEAKLIHEFYPFNKNFSGINISSSTYLFEDNIEFNSF